MKESCERLDVLDTRPEVERALMRTPCRGFEPVDDGASIRCISHDAQNQEIPWHHHAEYEIHLIGDRSGTACIGDWIGDFEPGQLVLLGPWVPHKWCSPEDGTSVPSHARRPDLAIQFSKDPLIAASRAVHELYPVDRLLRRADQSIEFLGVSDDFARLWQEIRDARGVKRFALFCTLLSMLEACPKQRVLSSAPQKTDGRSACLANIVRGMQSDPSLTPSVSDLASSMGASEGHFLRLFRQQIGLSFHAYLTHTRISAACRLLIETDHYVQSICYQVGFNNIASFNRRFLESKGITPTEFRRRSRSSPIPEKDLDDCLLAS